MPDRISATPFRESFGECTPFSNTTAQFGLTAATALSYTVPGQSDQKFRCEFSWPYNANVWVGYNVTATSPTENTMSSNANIELRPIARYVNGGDVLSFISISAVTDAGLRLLAIPG